VVPAEARLFERLSGAEVLEYAGRLRGLPAAEARSRAAQLLDVLDLTQDAKRLVADYSTGMRKKAALGCALIHNPPVLFLDEPLEGVDPVSADAIRRLLTRFAASGSTVLFSSHVMELVEQVCDHVSIIDKAPGLAADAIQDASDGHPGTALLRLALLAAVIVVLGWLWIRSLGRALVTADTTTQSAQVRGAALPLARYGLRGAVTARFWIYQRREPTSLVFWAMTAVIMAAICARAILGPDRHPTFVLASAVVGAGFVGYFHANAAGLTGPPFVLEASALTGRRELRSYFSGQDTALSVIAVPLLTAVTFGLAAVAGRPGFGFLGTAVGLAALGAALGLSNIFTVVLPYPMNKRAGSPLRQAAQGYAGQQFLGVFGSVGGAAVAALPVIVAVLTSMAPAAVRMPATYSAYTFLGSAGGGRPARRPTGRPG
jgi:hypothetical protein